MRILFIGDVVGKPGRQIIVRSVPALRAEMKLDLVVANAENAAGGSGLTPANFREILGAGVDCITLGDHAYRRHEIIPVMESDHRLVRPANYSSKAPGRSFTVVQAANTVRVGVVCLLGRVFMGPIDSPFDAADRVLSSLPRDVSVVLVDFHAEATSDMQLMGRYLDGRVTAVLGTHTHVATADEQIYPEGTAFQCDVGMTGPHESIIGRRVDRVLETATTSRPTHFEVATGQPELHGTMVEADPETGRATAIERVTIDHAQSERLAAQTRRNGGGSSAVNSAD